MAFSNDLLGMGVPGEVAARIPFCGVGQLAQTATGSAQTDALAITGKFVHCTTVAASTGVRLPLYSSRPDVDSVIVRNDGANTLNVYPGTSDTINALSANTAITIAAGASRVFVRGSTTKWLST